ncbi:MAG: CPBP family glutamic-type intramembrane protease [Puniceicoccaceae bacterium]
MGIKRILVFIIGVNVIAWGGILLLKGLIEDPALATSTAVSLITLGPVAMAVILRLILKENWSQAGLKLNLRGNGKWYLFAVAFPMVVIGTVYLLGIISGTGSFTSDMAGGTAKVLQMVSIMFFPMFFASIGEEFGWRGYLEPSLHKVTGSPLLTHVIVGVVWGVWHFPILILNDPDIQSVDLLAVVIGCTGLAIIYGQLKLRTGSVWPCVLLHAASNTFNIAFGIGKLMDFDKDSTGLVSLNSTSLAVVSTYLLIAFLFARQLKKDATA